MVGMCIRYALARIGFEAAEAVARRQRVL